MSLRDRYLWYDTAQALFDGTLPPSEGVAFAQLLASNQEAQDFYARLVRLDVELEWYCGIGGADGAIVTPPGTASPIAAPSVAPRHSTGLDSALHEDRDIDVTAPTVSPTHRRIYQFAAQTRRPVVWSILACGTLFVIYFAAISWGIFSKGLNRDIASEQPLAHPAVENNNSVVKYVATLTAAENCQWQVNDETIELRSGIRLLANNRLNLLSGVAEITFADGASVILEGPTNFVVQKSGRGKLDQGKLVAKVPPQAIGFTVITPVSHVVDLGTEFGVAVNANGQTEVNVFSGQVEYTLSGAPESHRLKSGNAVFISQNRSVVKVPSGTGGFVRSLKDRPETIRLREVPQPTAGLMAYYPFDRDTRDHAAEYAAHSGQQADDLTVTGQSQFMIGHVGGHSLKLIDGYATTPLSRDLQLPATFTIEAWVVMENPKPQFQRLVLNWGPVGQQAYHFGCFDNQLSLYLIQADGKEVFVNGGQVRPASWQHVATTADGKQMRLYLNGLEVASQAYDGTLFKNTHERFCIGDSAGAPSTADRFCGAIDELAIWGIALSGDQITDHVRRGSRGYNLLLKQGTQKQTQLPP